LKNIRIAILFCRMATLFADWQHFSTEWQHFSAEWQHFSAEWQYILAIAILWTAECKLAIALHMLQMLKAVLPLYPGPKSMRCPYLSRKWFGKLKLPKTSVPRNLFKIGHIHYRSKSLAKSNRFVFKTDSYKSVGYNTNNVHKERGGWGGMRSKYPQSLHCCQM
jgi:hypothetical protein